MVDGNLQKTGIVGIDTRGVPGCGHELFEQFLFLLGILLDLDPDIPLFTRHTDEKALLQTERPFRLRQLGSIGSDQIE